MKEKRSKIFSFNPQLPSVTAFLGGLTFTAMILTIQFPENFELPFFPKYSEVLIVASAIVSFFFIMTTIGGSIDQRNAPLITSRYRKFVSTLFGISIFGLIFIIPAFIFPFSIIGTVVLVIIEGICFSILLMTAPAIYEGDEKYTTGND